jgi:hypothetical protein
MTARVHCRLGSAAVWLLTAGTQRSVPLIGILSSAFEDTYAPVILPGFRASLKQAGLTVGQNLTIEYGWATATLSDYRNLPRTSCDGIYSNHICNRRRRYQSGLGLKPWSAGRERHPAAAQENHQDRRYR